MITNRSAYRSYLRDDLAAHGIMRWHFWLMLRYPTVRYQRVLRHVELWLNTDPSPLTRAMLLYWRVRLKYLGIRLGLTIPPNVFGAGLAIAHFGSVVVNDQVRAGRCVRLHNNVNIGVRNGRTPSIGDRVYIGPGAVLFGGIHIGDDCVIGANSVVDSDVPSGVTVAGAPARIIAHRNSADVFPAGVLSAVGYSSPKKV